jgi:hypothetical protein
MRIKHLLKSILLALTIIAAFIANTAFGQDSTRSAQVIKEWLPVPFGTIAKMTIEIVDGNELNDKGHQSSFLFRIKRIDSMAVAKPILMEFTDETGHFPSEDFALYKYLYGKKTGTLSSAQIEKMKTKYVGKEFIIAAYETGGFTGIPDGYYKYQPIRQDYGFHFKHHLVVVGDLTKRTQ